MVLPNIRRRANSNCWPDNIHNNIRDDNKEKCDIEGRLKYLDLNIPPPNTINRTLKFESKTVDIPRYNLNIKLDFELSPPTSSPSANLQRFPSKSSIKSNRMMKVRKRREAFIRDEKIGKYFHRRLSDKKVKFGRIETFEFSRVKAACTTARRAIGMSKHAHTHTIESLNPPNIEQFDDTRIGQSGRRVEPRGNNFHITPKARMIFLDNAGQKYTYNENLKNEVFRRIQFGIGCLCVNECDTFCPCRRANLPCNEKLCRCGKLDSCSSTGCGCSINPNACTKPRVECGWKRVLVPKNRRRNIDDWRSKMLDHLKQQPNGVSAYDAPQFVKERVKVYCKEDCVLRRMKESDELHRFVDFDPRYKETDVDSMAALERYYEGAAVTVDQANEESDDETEEYESEEEEEEAEEPEASAIFQRTLDRGVTVILPNVGITPMPIVNLIPEEDMEYTPSTPIQHGYYGKLVATPSTPSSISCTNQPNLTAIRRSSDLETFVADKADQQTDRYRGEDSVASVSAAPYAPVAPIADMIGDEPMEVNEQKELDRRRMVDNPHNQEKHTETVRRPRYIYEEDLWNDETMDYVEPHTDYSANDHAFLEHNSEVFGEESEGRGTFIDRNEGYDVVNTPKVMHIAQDEPRLENHVEVDCAPMNGYDRYADVEKEGFDKIEEEKLEDVDVEPMDINTDDNLNLPEYHDNQSRDIVIDSQHTTLHAPSTANAHVDMVKTSSSTSIIAPYFHPPVLDRNGNVPDYSLFANKMYIDARVEDIAAMLEEIYMSNQRARMERENGTYEEDNSYEKHMEVDEFEQEQYRLGITLNCVYSADMESDSNPAPDHVFPHTNHEDLSVEADSEDIDLATAIAVSSDIIVTSVASPSVASVASSVAPSLVAPISPPTVAPTVTVPPLIIPVPPAAIVLALPPLPPAQPQPMPIRRRGRRPFGPHLPSPYGQMRAAAPPPSTNLRVHVDYQSLHTDVMKAMDHLALFDFGSNGLDYLLKLKRIKTGCESKMKANSSANLATIAKRFAVIAAEIGF